MEAILAAAANIFDPSTLLVLAIGTVVGLFVGALPGLSSTMGVALCIPITFGMDPANALVLLGAIYTSSVFGGSITAILLRTPGTDASIATTFDGYPMAQRGEGAQAIGMALVASLIGGVFSVCVLLFVAPPLSRLALLFGPQEYVYLTIFGMISILGVSGGNPTKAFISAALGLLLATVGFDLFTGYPRLTFGQDELFEGVPLLPALIGIFSVSQAISLCTGEADIGAGNMIKTKGRTLPAWSVIRRCGRTLFKSSLIGSAIGILPGAGTSVAAFISYDEARRRSKTPEAFGKGEIEGVAAPEAANNAVTGGSLVPALTLGIPGNAVTAVFIGGLTIHGLVPGPRLFTDHAEIVYTLILSLFLANLAFAALGLFAAPWVARVVKVPSAVLGPTIIVFSVIGSYALRNSLFDVWLVLGFGVLGYFMERWRIPGAPLVIALVLGPILETNLRRSLQISGGDWMIFFTSPLSYAIMALIVLTLAYPIFARRQQRKREQDAS
ncbi:tripartite tricarboxylate transporter permease [Afifella sp. YEN Y35]|uniref:tripartite tricarboxylate transporter permease n=1 Tax=Afifella sp. YEN Y35 TaxID=3388337 RepID=UPI0039E05A46